MTISLDRRTCLAATVGVLVGAILTSVLSTRGGQLEMVRTGARKSFELADDKSHRPEETAASGDSPDANPPINFMESPDTFVDVMDSCEHDDNCRLIFHHVFKTGGTTIEKNLAGLWNQKHSNSCCGEKRVLDFYKRKEDFCSNKFSSHQMDAHLFFGIVDECANKFPLEKSLPPPDLVLLTTFREPIQMTISQIHQMCNRRPEKRSQRVLDACSVCNYDEYTDVWDDMIDTVTQQLEAAWQVSRLQTNITLPANTRVLSLENSDITDFFARFKPKHKIFVSNKEKLLTCNFRPTSAMLKKLQDAQRFYRQLVANKDYH